MRRARDRRGERILCLQATSFIAKELDVAGFEPSAADERDFDQLQPSSDNKRRNASGGFERTPRHAVIGSTGVDGHSLLECGA